MIEESGAAGVLVAGLAAVSIVICLLLADVASVTVARARLTTAADAAALAAAPVTFSRFGTDGDPVRAAVAAAAGNGVEFVRCDCSIDRTWSTRTVTVTVAVTVQLLLLGERRLTRVAAAEFRPTSLVAGT